MACLLTQHAQAGTAETSVADIVKPPKVFKREHFLGRPPHQKGGRTWCLSSGRAVLANGKALLVPGRLAFSVPPHGPMGRGSRTTYGNLLRRIR